MSRVFTVWQGEGGQLYFLLSSYHLEWLGFFRNSAQLLCNCKLSLWCQKCPQRMRNAVLHYILHDLRASFRNSLNSTCFCNSNESGSYSHTCFIDDLLQEGTVGGGQLDKYVFTETYLMLNHTFQHVAHNRSFCFCDREFCFINREKASSGSKIIS